MSSRSWPSPSLGLRDPAPTSSSSKSPFSNSVCGNSTTASTPSRTSFVHRRHPLPKSSTEPPPLGITPSPNPPAAPARDLESVIGSNWLSKLGVSILLFGLALFLGFSLTAMGPAEREPALTVFGGALIAGGWAAFYSSAYAAHALPAARIIDSPLLGFALLLVVTAGRVAHSLRYE
jgi:uncharacterized membrane protein